METRSPLGRAEGINADCHRTWHFERLLEQAIVLPLEADRHNRILNGLPCEGSFLRENPGRGTLVAPQQASIVTRQPLEGSEEVFQRRRLKLLSFRTSPAMSFMLALSASIVSGQASKAHKDELPRGTANCEIQRFSRSFSWGSNGERR